MNVFSFLKWMNVFLMPMQRTNVNRQIQKEIALTQTNMDGSNCTIHRSTNRNMNSISFYCVALEIGLSEDVCLGALEPPSLMSAALFYRFGNTHVVVVRMCVYSSCFPILRHIFLVHFSFVFHSVIFGHLTWIRLRTFHRPVRFNRYCVSVNDFQCEKKNVWRFGTIFHLQLKT